MTYTADHIERLRREQAQAVEDAFGTCVCDPNRWGPGGYDDLGYMDEAPWCDLCKAKAAGVLGVCWTCGELVLTDTLTNDDWDCPACACTSEEVV